MRLWILSDLHHECQPELPLVAPEADICVLAGDIARPLTGAVEWASRVIAPHMPIVLVPGNHEFYGDSVVGGIERGIQATSHHSNVHLLIMNATVIGGVRLVGATLWTDYELEAKGIGERQRNLAIAYAMKNAGGLLLDHSAIAVSDDTSDRWQPSNARAMHKLTRTYIGSVLAQPFKGPTVIVTHHAPHPGSVAPQFKGNPLNPAFTSDLSELIWQHQPTIWVHGHMHHSVKYSVGETLIVCNPRGYDGENSDFDATLVLEI